MACVIDDASPFASTGSKGAIHRLLRELWRKNEIVAAVQHEDWSMHVRREVQLIGFGKTLLEIESGIEK